MEHAIYSMHSCANKLDCRITGLAKRIWNGQMGTLMRSFSGYKLTMPEKKEQSWQQVCVYARTSTGASDRSVHYAGSKFTVHITRDQHLALFLVLNSALSAIEGILRYWRYILGAELPRTPPSRPNSVIGLGGPGEHSAQCPLA